MYRGEIVWMVEAGLNSEEMGQTNPKQTGNDVNEKFREPSEMIHYARKHLTVDCLRDLHIRNSSRMYLIIICGLKEGPLNR